MDDDAPRERRRATRHMACFPAHIDVREGAHVALIRNLSVTGALVLVSGEVQADARVELSLYLIGAEVPTLAPGRVVRCERRDASGEVGEGEVATRDGAEGKSGAEWPFVLAIEFDSPIANLEDEIAALAAKDAAREEG